MRSLPPKLRRLGFVATLACGVSLLGVGVTGVAALDDRLEVASSGPPDARFIEYRMNRDDAPKHNRCRRDRESDES
jgi:hypothetical protein